MTPNTAWPVKIAYICLVLWVAVISPLIYFGNYSSHKGVQGYPLNVWQNSTTAYKLNQALAQIAAQTQPERQTARALSLHSGPSVSAANRAIRVHGQNLTRYHEYLIAAIVAPVLILSLLFRHVLAHVSRKQLRLPPPERPPTFLFGF